MNYKKLGITLFFSVLALYPLHKIFAYSICAIMESGYVVGADKGACGGSATTIVKFQNQAVIDNLVAIKESALVAATAATKAREAAETAKKAAIETANVAGKTAAEIKTITDAEDAKIAVLKTAETLAKTKSTEAIDAATKETARAVAGLADVVSGSFKQQVASSIPRIIDFSLGVAALSKPYTGYLQATNTNNQRLAWAIDTSGRWCTASTTCLSKDNSACGPWSGWPIGGVATSTPNASQLKIDFGTAGRVASKCFFKATVMDAVQTAASSSREFYLITGCQADYHVNDRGICISDVQSCYDSAKNILLGSQTWNGSDWGDCVPTDISCNAGLHLEVVSNKCISNIQLGSCVDSISHISEGHKTWNGSGWSTCMPTTTGCETNYEFDLATRSCVTKTACQSSTTAPGCNASGLIVHGVINASKACISGTNNVCYSGCEFSTDPAKNYIWNAQEQRCLLECRFDASGNLNLTDADPCIMQ